MPSTTPCLTAYVQYGDNSSSGSDPEYGIQDSSGADVAIGQMTWDPSPSGGMDSGWLLVSLAANVGGGASGISWTVAGGATVPLTTTAIAYGRIERVTITATVTSGGLAISYRNLKVKFYVGASLKQTVSISTSHCPVANTLGVIGVSAEMSAGASPLRSDIDRCVVEAELRLRTDDGLTPLPSDILGAIKVFTSTCNP